ncbi:diacylglycerol kinase [Porticoccus sp.]|uniref:diacylglycerol kinase n=1 Tax=Porticoccus sp. TaxID=2024853 RepID=UPI003F69D4F6
MERIYGLLKRRALHATMYSWRGLRACLEYEEAFRVEVAVACLLFPLAFFAAKNPVELVLLLGSVLLLLIVELLNSAVEAAIDRISEEHHDLSGRAKDLGSAAVLLTILLVIITWVAIAIQ